MLNFCDFIQVCVSSTNHHLKGTSHGFWVPGKKGDLFSAS